MLFGLCNLFTQLSLLFLWAIYSFLQNLGDILSGIRDLQKDNMLLVRYDFVLNINHELSVDSQFDLVQV